MFHKRLLKEFSDNRKYVAGMVIMQWAALLANVALMYVLAAYVGRISGIVKGESLTTSPSDGVLLIVFAAALFVRIAATSAANRMSYLASTQVKRRLRDRIYEDDGVRGGLPGGGGDLGGGADRDGGSGSA